MGAVFWFLVFISNGRLLAFDGLFPSFFYIWLFQYRCSNE
jgi:hypothetical protein